ncbi:MAG: co-chaperone GroES [Patescibacteria group bacterium]|nr:co-chaperone GroES [bacterium]MDZ4240844.1 co-chaperone GroES [Patescibacteria group bacterium]
MKKQSSTDSYQAIMPLGDRVLVKPLTSDVKKTDSGIIIPETVDKEKPEQGKVIAVGEGRYEDGKLVPMRVKKGQKIVFSKYGYDEIKINGEEFYIIEEKNILAVVKE